MTFREWAALILGVLTISAVLVLSAGGEDNSLPVDWPYGWSRPSVLLETERRAGPLAFCRTADGLTVVGREHSDRLFIAKLSPSGCVERHATWQITLEGSISKLQVAVDKHGVSHVAWLERRADRTLIGYARLSAELKPEVASSVAVYSTRVLGDGDLELDPQGYPVLFWSETVHGPADIFMGRIDETGEVTKAVRLVGFGDSDILPEATFDERAQLHLTWNRKADTYDDLYYQLFDADGTALGQSQLVGSNTIDRFRQPTMLLGPGGNVHILWTGEGETPGHMGINHVAANVKGQLTEIVTLAEGEPNAAVEHPSAVIGPDQSLYIVWGEKTEPAAQAYYTSVALNALKPGMDRPAKQKLTLGPKGHFEPRVWLGDGGYPAVLYYSVDSASTSPELLQAWTINSRESVSPGILYVLGYGNAGGIETLWTILYAQSQVLASAVARALASVGAMVAAYLVVGLLRRIGVYSPSLWGRRLQLLSMMAAVWVLKDPRTLIYVQPTMRPGGFDVVVFTLAALGTFLFLAWRRMSLDDELSLVSGLVLFVCWELYLSTIPVLATYVL